MCLTGVEAMAERAVDELSGGELQRVWLATCLAQDTGVVLLDEPTTFLDLRYQVETLDIVRDLADEHGVAVGVVLHDLDQAAAVADQVVLLHEGVVRATGRPADVLTTDLLSEVYGIRIDVRDRRGRSTARRPHPAGRPAHDSPPHLHPRLITETNHAHLAPLEQSAITAAALLGRSPGRLRHDRGRQPTRAARARPRRPGRST